MTAAQEASRRAARAQAAVAAAERQRKRASADYERAVHDLAAQMRSTTATPTPIRKDDPIDPTPEADQSATDRAWHQMRTTTGAPLTPPVSPAQGDQPDDADTAAALAQMTNAVGIRLTSTN